MKSILQKKSVTIQFRPRIEKIRRTGRRIPLLNFKRLAPILGVTVLLTGCSMLQPEKLRQASIGATDRIAGANSLEATKNVLPPTMPATLTVGKDGAVKMEFPPASSASVKATSEQNATAYGNSAATDSSKFTAGQKLILWGIGILMVALVVAWKFVSKTAIGKGIQIGDQFASRALDQVRSLATKETDPKRQVELSSVMASLESERGKLNNDRVEK